MTRYKSPTWAEVRELLDKAGYDPYLWEVDIQRDLIEAILRMAGEIVGENAIDARRAYHNNAQRHAAVELIVRVVLNTLRYGADVTVASEQVMNRYTTDIQELRKIFLAEVDESKE